MLISEKTTGSIFFFFFASKGTYPIVRQLEKNNGERSASESSKMREKQILGPRTPLVTKVLKKRRKIRNFPPKFV